MTPLRPQYVFLYIAEQGFSQWNGTLFMYSLLSLYEGFLRQLKKNATMFGLYGCLFYTGKSSVITYEPFRSICINRY